MIKRELKFNLKSFLLWTSILIVMYLVVFLIYPSIVNSDSIGSLDELMAVFPEELLTAFNMDISSISTAYGWLKTEGFVFILLVTASYAGIIGSSIILKEESDKTIEYLNSLPVSRNKIFLSKYLVGLLYVILMIIIIGLFNFVGLKLSGDLDNLEYLYLSITPIFPCIVTYSLCVLISVFSHKTKKVYGVGLGIVFISYILNTLSTLDKSVEFLKYGSVFTLADVRNVIIDVCINPVMIVTSLALTIIFGILALVKFNKKSLI